MNTLENSSRKLLRATYVQIKSEPAKRPLGKRAWEKRALIANLAISRDEVARLRKLFATGPKKKKDSLAALQAIAAVAAERTTVDVIQNVASFGDIGWGTLAGISEAVTKLRQDDFAVVDGVYSRIVRAMEREKRPQKAEENKQTLANDPTPSMPIQTALGWARKNKVQDLDSIKISKMTPLISAFPITATKTEFDTWANARIQVAHDSVVAMKQNATTEPIGLLHLERLDFVPAGIERGELVYSVPLSPGEEVNITHKEWSNTSEEFSKIATDFQEAYSEEGVAEKSELVHSTNSQEQHSSGLNTGITASGGYGPVSVTSTVSVNIAASASQSEQTARDHSIAITRKASARSKKEHKQSFKVASAAGTADQQVRKIRNPFSDKATRVDYYQLVRKWRVDLFRYGVRLTYDITIPEPGSGILSKVQEIQAITSALQQGFGDSNSTVPWARFDLTPNKITREDWIVGKYGEVLDPPPEPEIEWPVTRNITVTGDTKKIENTFFFTIEFDVQEGYEITGVTEVDKSAYNHATPYVLGYRPGGDDPPQLLGMSGKVAIVMETRLVWSFFVQLRIKASLRPEAYAGWQIKAWKILRDAAQARYEENRQNLKNRLSSLLEEMGAQDPLSLRKIEREEVMKGVIRWLFGPEFEFSANVPEYVHGTEFPVFSKHPIAQAVVAYWMNKVRTHEEIIKFLHHAIEWENMLYFLYPYFWSHRSRWELKKYLNHPDLMHRAFLKSGSARVVLTIRPGFEKAFASLLDTGKVNSDYPYLKITEEMEAYAKTNYPGIRPANPTEDARPLLSYKQRQAWNDMQAVIGLLEEYRQDKGSYPTTAQGLAVLAPYGSFAAQDPWGNPYSYKSPGQANDFELASHGADGLPGGEDDAADITSWAEASLIGRWYEYTPTSALDIAFGETIPVA